MAVFFFIYFLVPRPKRGSYSNGIKGIPLELKGQKEFLGFITRILEIGDWLPMWRCPEKMCVTVI